MPGHPADQPTFLYDLGDPRCYLMAERVMQALPVIPEWQPVLAGGVGAGAPIPLDPAQLEGLAEELGIQPIRWPPTVPADSRLAMLAATYAKQIGRGVSFSLAAFRQAFAGGHDLAREETVLIAGAACEMHPTALLRSLQRPTVARALDEATIAARAAGIDSLPAILVDGQAFCGDGALERAAAALRARAGRPQPRPA